MAKKNKVAPSTAFCMTGTECAEFIVKNAKKIASRLRGKCEDVEDAIAEIACKCLQAKNGFATLLKWGKDPFAAARTEKEWLSFVAWQCRSRLGVIRYRNGYWFDPDIVKPDIVKQDKTEDEGDGFLPVDNAANEASGDNDEEEPDPAGEKLRRKRRIVAFLIAEDERRASNYEPNPGKSHDDEIKYKAAYAVLADLVKYHSVSKRNIAIWIAKVLHCRDRYEIAEKFGVTPNNIDQIVHKINGKLNKFGPALHWKHARRLSGAAA